MGEEIVPFQPHGAVARAQEIADTLGLGELEEVLAGSAAGFIAFATALGSILKRRLYRETHDTWDDYCRERIGISGKAARRQIAQAEAAEDGKVPSQRELARGTRASRSPDRATPEGSIPAKSEEVPTSTLGIFKATLRLRPGDLAGYKPEQLRQARDIFVKALAAQAKGSADPAPVREKLAPTAEQAKCPHNMRNLKTGECLKCGHVR